MSGVVAFNRFSLQDDEALLITLDAGDLGDGLVLVRQIDSRDADGGGGI